MRTGQWRAKIIHNNKVDNFMSSASREKEKEYVL